MNFVWGGVLLWGALLGASASAEPAAFCPTVDLRTVFPLAIRDQGDLSWCYAHTAADFLQFVERVPEPISAADIAIQYSERLWPRVLQFFQGTEVRQYGFLRPALRDVLEIGYCPESAFPSSEWTRVTREASGAARIEKAPISAAIRETLNLRRRVDSGQVRQASDLPFHFEFPGVGRERFFEVLRDSGPGDLLWNLRDAACEGRRHPFAKPLQRISMRVRTGRSFGRIRESLEAGLPVSIDYFDGVLENSDGFRKKLLSLHTSLLVGQRYDDSARECQYLVKNSFGESCEGYDPRIECDRGYLWVGETALGRALVSWVQVQP